MIRIAAFALALALAATPALARPRCERPAEMAQMQFRQLQVELMVATLKCDGTGYDYRGGYASYMHKAAPALARNARLLKAMFVRQGRGASYMDRYLTGMSNDAQIRGQAAPDYCGAAARALAAVDRMEVRDLTAFAARQIPRPYAATPCSTKAKAHRKSNHRKPGHRKFHNRHKHLHHVASASR